MVHVTIGKGDKGYDLQLTVNESDGTAKDLTGWTGTFTAWSPTTPDTTVATIVGATSDTAGVYHIALSTDFASAAYYEGRLILTAPGY